MVASTPTTVCSFLSKVIRLPERADIVIKVSTRSNPYLAMCVAAAKVTRAKSVHANGEEHSSTPPAASSIKLN